MTVADLRAAMLVPGGWQRWCRDDDECEWLALWEACCSLLHTSLKARPSANSLRFPLPPHPLPPARAPPQPLPPALPPHPLPPARADRPLEESTGVASDHDSRGEGAGGGDGGGGGGGGDGGAEAGVPAGEGQGPGVAGAGGLFAPRAWVGSTLAVVGGAVNTHARARTHTRTQTYTLSHLHKDKQGALSLARAHTEPLSHTQAQTRRWAAP